DCNCKINFLELVCPAGWEKYQSQCLKVFNDTASSYTGAVTACQTEGSTLASVPAVFAADVIGDLVTAAGWSEAYVGLHKPINGMYTYEDGTRLVHKYLMTKENKLDHSEEKCGTLGENYNFETRSCTSLLAFVCQKPLDEYGIPTDFSNLPCSTDNFCNNTNLVCAQWKDKSTFLTPKCVGI
ncbi:snaclec B1-like, partial [Mizuhopecten yessoensis]|uniref:snaclec B1-like n=1 Tax=Mizuhopecten yessoensis TaxID=6573 RepID=UPI000B458B2F